MKVYNPKTKKFEDDEIKQNNTSINVYDPSTQTFGNKVKEPEQNTWFRAGALQDGYQFGDIGKTILGTGADILHRGVKGIVKTGEGIGDFGAYLAAQGIETLGNKDYANQVRQAANESLTDKVFAPIDKTLDKNSLLGKKSQGVAESIGQIGAYAATGGVNPKLGTATMFTSAAGTAGNEAYSKENVTNEQAWTKMLAGGAISTATEKAFGLFGKSGLDNAVANKISSKLTKGISKTLARLGVQATSEAFEELMEYTGNQLLDMGIDAASQGKGAKFHEDWNWEEVGQQMAMAAIASGIVGAGTTAMGLKGTPGSNLNERLNNYAELIDIQEGVKSKEQVKLPGIRTEQSISNNIEQLKEQQKQTTDNKLKQELATKISELEQELNQFKLPMASTEGMNLMESASKYNIKPETQSAVQQLMENRGIESRWDATKFSDNSVNALWTKDANGNRSVIFNPNASLDTIVEDVALHELTHDILSSENTTLNAQKILDYVSQLDGYNEARQSLENTYSTMYDPNSADFKSLIDEEVVADVLGRKLGNQEFINQLVNSKPSIAKSIYNWVISKLNSIVNKGKVRSEKLYWQNIKNNFENAYKQEYKNNEMASTKYSKENAEWNEFLDKNISEDSNEKKYRGSHQIENAKSIVELNIDDVINKIKDIDGYLTNQSESDLKKLKKILNNPDGKVTIYRAAPVNELNSGDWVTTDKTYAKNVADNNGGKVYSYEVNANELYYPDNVNDLPSLHRLSSFQYNENIQNNAKYSITQDNQGRELSDYVLEKAKDSKVRDEDGNLMLMYHGSPNGEYNQLRAGTYFTPNKEYADGYQNTWASSLANSGKESINPKTYEAYLNITNPFTLQNEKAKQIYLNEYIKGGNSLYYDPYTDYTDTINSMDEIDWTEGEDLKEWLIENHPEYDGLVLDEGGDGGYGEAEYRWRGKSYIPFSEEQIIPANDNNTKYSKQSEEWDKWNNKTIAPEGTKTKLKDIKLPKKEINLPKSTQVKQETRQEVKLPTRETITKEELEELDSLKALNEITDLSREEQNRLDYLEKKQQGYTERYPGLKKVTDFKEISREYGKYRDLDNFDRTLLRDAESMIKGYRNTERRTKDEWLSIARYIGSNFKGNSEELQKYAIQSWFAASPNQKGSLNRQGKGFVDFKIQEWINSMYDGARVGELDKPSTPKKQTILPMAREDNVLKVNANEIADFMNGISGNQRGWAKTATESDVLKDKVLIKDLDASKLNYVVESNQKSLDKANKKMDTLGYEGSVNYAKQLINDEKLPSATDMALIQRTIQEAAQNGDSQTAIDLLMDLTILGTDLGQATQALSMIKRLTPEGQLSMYTKMIKRAKSRGEKSFENVEITPEMVEMVLNAYKSDGTYDQEDLNNRVENFKQEIANQMKTTTGEKINAWRYLAMLGNPKTHIRNIVSNVAMNGTIKVKNAMARTLESVLPIKNRTKTWKKATDFIKNYAEKTANEMKGIITGENKYNEKSSLESKKRTFKSDTLEKISNFNSNALEAEDWFFSKRAFISNLEEYLTANGINTQEDIESRPEVVEKAKNYAKEQAEIATFRQYSKLAAQINNIEKNNKIARFFIEATVPFKKTPINVAKAGVKYSPLGLIKSLSYDIYQVKQGNMEASQLIDNISQGLTGTSLAILGYALAKNGILNGGGDDDKEGKYDTQLGDNQYSLKIGDKSYSISWLSPVAMPLLVGANAFEQLEEKEEWDMNVVSETLAKTLDPLNEMSFMQGLTNALSSYDKGVEKLAGIGESVAQNYVGQFFPTIFSQFASTIDDKKRSTKASANSTYKFGEQTLRSIMYKLPGLRQQLEVATDVWGNEKEQADNIIQRAYESFLAPYSTTKNITSDLDKEIKRIYNETGETKVIPGIPYSYVKYGDETYRMSANEYTKYKKTYGTTASSTLSSLIKSDSYKNASDEDKAKMIDNAYDYARAKANEEYFSNISDVNYENKTLDKLNVLKSEFGINASTYYANKNEYDYAYQNSNKYKTIKQITSYDKYSEYKEKITTIKENTKNDKEEVINYINSLSLSIPQKAMFIKQYYKSFNNYDNEIINYINSQKLSSKDKQTILEQLGFTIRDGRVYK